MDMLTTYVQQYQTMWLWQKSQYSLCASLLPIRRHYRNVVAAEHMQKKRDCGCVRKASTVCVRVWLVGAGSHASLPPDRPHVHMLLLLLPVIMVMIMMERKITMKWRRRSQKPCWETFHSHLIFDTYAQKFIQFTTLKAKTSLENHVIKDFVDFM